MPPSYSESFLAELRLEEAAVAAMQAAKLAPKPPPKKPKTIAKEPNEQQRKEFNSAAGSSDQPPTSAAGSSIQPPTSAAGSSNQPPDLAAGSSVQTPKIEADLQKFEIHDGSDLAPPVVEQDLAENVSSGSRPKKR